MDTPYDKTHYKSGFWALIATQFQGTFSDNVFKTIIVYMLMGAAFTDPAIAEMARAGEISQMAGMAGMLFAIPFIIFPAISGSISDRFSKKKVIVGTKCLEIAVMCLGGLVIYLAQAPLLWIVLFLMAAQSALFSPSKYGILPEAIPEPRLSWGNGILQMMTMVAIITGQLVAGTVFDRLNEINKVYLASAGLVALAMIGLTTARYIFAPPAANPQKRIAINPFSGTGEVFKAYAADKWLALAVTAYSYFWFAGALLNANMFPFGSVELELQPTQISYLLGSLAAGIGAGAASAGYVSRGKIETGLIPLGALGMTVFSALLAIPGFSFTACLALLFFLGFSGGVFDVPLAATVQQRSPQHMRGRVIATTNMLTFTGIFSASALMWFLGKQGVSPYSIFLLGAALSLAVGLFICFTLPIFVVRLILWVLSSTLYRLNAFDRENVPERGGALLVANHTSFLDALVILAAIDRPVRFIMYKGTYDTPWVKPIAKMMGAIPVMPGGNLRDIVDSLRGATDAVERGELVCIFAEGQISRTGQMLPFRRGFERIMKGVDAPIIPVYIDEIWGSIFSFSKGKFFWKLPTRIPHSVTVGFGAPLPPDTDSVTLRCAIQELGTDAAMKRRRKGRLLHRAFVRKARRHPFEMAIADQRYGKQSNFKTLVGSIILARKLKSRLGDEEMTGVLLPQSVPGVLSNIALQIMGKVPVNLNYTASNEALAVAADRCAMKHVLTAKAFLEKVPVELPAEPIFLDEVMKSVTITDRLTALVMALCVPMKLLERFLGAPRNRTSDDVATVIFSSGSEGEPKGVMLTHFNMFSNIDSAMQVFPHKNGDCVMGMLPFFHSFGFTGTLWLPLTYRFRAVYHPNPMESRPIGELIKKYKINLLFSTSTFLQSFIRRCSATQLSSIEHILTGAEKLSPRVRDAFREKFGVEPLEGYGTTECAPIVALNTPDFRAPGVYQKGNKRDSIGHPLPGISARVVDPDTRDPLPTGKAGLLLISGPNIMKGYLGQPEKTASVLKDGWYETGDIATIDEDGFITITDRLARFSKIAGEMVSHTKIEDALQDVLGETDRVVAVSGVPDESKGERLVVVHTLSDARLDELLGNLSEIGLPNLWIPKPKAFYKIDEIPVLGTGKMDIKAVKSLAHQLDIGE